MAVEMRERIVVAGRAQPERGASGDAAIATRIRVDLGSLSLSLSRWVQQMGLVGLVFVFLL